MVSIAQCMLLIGVLGLMPLYIGEGICRISGYYSKWNITGILFRALFGNLLMWAVFECITVPVLLLQGPFDLVVWLWTIAIGGILFCTFVTYRRETGEALRQPDRKKWTVFEIIVAMLAAGFVFQQMYMYVAYMHLDEDDVYFLGNALNTLEYGTMSMSGYETGVVMPHLFYSKGDAVCAWLYYFALLSRLITLSPTIIAHTFLPVSLLIMMYAAYWLIADIVFDSDRQSCLLCVLFVALINMYFSGSAYTQSIFSLTRIWQGKAVTAAIIVPSVLFFMLLTHKRGEEGRIYMLYAILNIAACSLSWIGILIAAVLGSVYGIYNIAVHRKKKMTVYYALSLMPIAILGCMYFLLFKFPKLFS